MGPGAGREQPRARRGPTSLNGLLQLLMLGLQLGEDASPAQVLLQFLGSPKKNLKLESQLWALPAPRLPPS